MVQAHFAFGLACPLIIPLLPNPPISITIFK